MLKRAGLIAEHIRKQQKIHVVSHIDADGITAGAIAIQTLKRLGKEYSIEFVKQLDPPVLEQLKNDNHDLVWFTDLGSSICTNPPKISMVISDHHSCEEMLDVSFHLNPHLFGLDGSIHLSGAGATYLIAKAIDKNNVDLSALAIVGACGDLQDRRYRKLTGKNREILNDGEKTGVIRTQIDIQYFGRETRPVHKLLQYANDPLIPGVSGLESGSISFLQKKGIPLKDGETWRRWIDLGKQERQIILSELARLLLVKGFGHETVKRVIGEVYLLPKEDEGTELHDAKEFATLLNSTARYGQYEVGLNVCLGDREKWLKKARNLLRGHRQNLVEGVQFVKDEGIEQREFVQFFHAGSGIRDTIIGIVTNMLLNDEQTRNDMPLVGFAEKNNAEVKASARATQFLVDKGLDLSVAVRKAALSVNGVGGGHNIAAGATIPKGEEEKFLEVFEEEVKTQLSS